MMNLNEAFATRVKELLKEKNMSQYKLAQETGLYPSTLHYIIHSKTKSSNFKTMALIIKALGVSMNEFCDSSVFDFDNLEIDE